MGCHEFIYMDIGGLNGFWVAGGEIEGGTGKRKCFSGGKIVLPVVGGKNHGRESKTGCLFYI